MKRIVILFLSSLIIGSCNLTNQVSDEQKSDAETEQWNKIKGSWNYLDFNEFIEQNPKSLKFDSALNLLFKTRNILFDSITPVPWHCGTECAQILISQNGAILFNEIPISSDSVFEYSYHFIIQLHTSLFTNEVENYQISNAKFELVFIKGSVPNLQFTVYEIRKAFEVYKMSLSLKWYNKRLDKLKPEQRNKIDSLLVPRIIFTDITELPINQKGAKKICSPF